MTPPDYSSELQMLDVRKVLVRLDKLDVQMSNISHQLILMQQQQHGAVRPQDFKTIMEEVIQYKMPPLFDNATAQTQSAIDRNALLVKDLCEKTNADSPSIINLLRNMGRELDNLIKKIDEQGTKFTVQEFEAFAERERQNLKLVVEYAQAMNARFAVPHTPRLGHHFPPLLDYSHHGSASWPAEHQTTFKERIQPPTAPPTMDLVQRYEEQSRQAKSIFSHRSPNKQDPRPPKETESASSAEQTTSYSQFLEWQREQREKDRS